MQSIRSNIYKFIYSTFFEALVIMAIIASIVLLIIDTSMHLTSPSDNIVNILELSLNSFFIIEYSIKILLSTNKWLFFKGNLIDFIALLPIFRVFRLVRVLRLIRLIKIVRLNRWEKIVSAKLKLFNSEFSENFFEAFTVSLILFILVLVGSIGMSIFERGHNEQFVSFFDGIWWAVVTLTTVGYGDKFPVTIGGRILASAFMFIGLSFFGLITGMFSSSIIKYYKKKENRGVDIMNLKDHIVICGWNNNATIVLKELTELFKNTDKDFVIIKEDQPEYIFTNNIHYMKGDFTKKDILERAQIVFASSVIVLADQVTNRSNQDIDARTVLTALAIDKLNSDVYTCVEVLSSDNIEHVLNAGVDEYIIAANYTGNLLAHAVRYPGITKVYNELLSSTEGSQIYNGSLSKNSEFCGEIFSQCVVDIFNKYSSILIGVERDGIYNLNPENFQLKERDSLVYISSQEHDFKIK
ncbi:MAG: hypothetical protein GY817_01845 [bacterium]|nr:hypothetical protein [bacterium]